MSLALALRLCHHRIVSRVCTYCQPYNNAILVHDLLNVILVVTVAGQNFQKVVERPCARQCGLNLTIKRDKFGPWHNTNCKLRTPCHLIWRVRRSGLLSIRDEEREKSEYVSLNTIWIDAIRARLKEILCYGYNVRRGPGKW